MLNAEILLLQPYPDTLLLQPCYAERDLQSCSFSAGQHPLHLLPSSSLVEGRHPLLLFPSSSLVERRNDFCYVTADRHVQRLPLQLLARLPGKLTVLPFQCSCSRTFCGLPRSFYWDAISPSLLLGIPQAPEE